MEIFLKIPPRSYNRLRSYIPTDSPAHEAIEKASRIDHAVEGVVFAGYSIPCNEHHLRIILEVAKECCPEIVRDVEEALTRSRLAE
jgi:hypothetical protein